MDTENTLWGASNRNLPITCFCTLNQFYSNQYKSLETFVHISGSFFQIRRRWLVCLYIHQHHSSLQSVHLLSLSQSAVPDTEVRETALEILNKRHSTKIEKYTFPLSLNLFSLTFIHRSTLLLPVSCLLSSKLDWVSVILRFLKRSLSVPQPRLFCAGRNWVSARALSGVSQKEMWRHGFFCGRQWLNM